MAKAKKKGFVLYDDYYEHIRLLSVKEKALLLDAIFAKRMGTEIPKLPPKAMMAFSFIGAQLDRDQERYEDTCQKRKAFGMLGGRPKKNVSDNANQKGKKPYETIRFFEKPKKPDIDIDKEKEKEKEIERLYSGAKAPLNARARAQRIPPTVEEVRTYCSERGNNVDPERFFDHYVANGWKVGKAPMKDWRAAVRNWERSEKERSPLGKQESDPFVDYMREELAREEAKERGETL